MNRTGGVCRLVRRMRPLAATRVNQICSWLQDQRQVPSRANRGGSPRRMRPDRHWPDSAANRIVFIGRPRTSGGSLGFSAATLSNLNSRWLCRASRR